MSFALAAFGCLLIDRDSARARLAAALPVDEDGRVRPDGHTGDHARTGMRPWRLAADLFLGLAASTKWNGLYFFAFLILTLLWDVGARRVAGARRPYRAVLRKDLNWSVLPLVPVAVVTYLATWTWSWIPASLRSLWHYEYGVYQFNVGLHTPHKWKSNPWSWLVLGRPVLLHYESPKPGTDDWRCAATGAPAPSTSSRSTPGRRSRTPTGAPGCGSTPGSETGRTVLVALAHLVGERVAGRHGR